MKWGRSTCASYGARWRAHGDHSPGAALPQPLLSLSLSLSASHVLGFRCSWFLASFASLVRDALPALSFCTHSSLLCTVLLLLCSLWCSRLSSALFRLCLAYASHSARATCILCITYKVTCTCALKCFQMICSGREVFCEIWFRTGDSVCDLCALAPAERTCFMSTRFLSYYKMRESSLQRRD